MESHSDILKTQSLEIDYDSEQYIHSTYISISDPEEYNGSDVESFDEDDMFALDNDDDIVVEYLGSAAPMPLNDGITDQMNPGANIQQTLQDDVTNSDRDSDNDVRTYFADVIGTLEDTAEDVEISQDISCHDLIQDIRSVCIEFENASIMAKALYEACAQEMGNLSQSNIAKMLNWFSYLQFIYTVSILTTVHSMPWCRDVIVPNALKGIEEVVVTHTKTKHGTICTKEKIVPVVLPKQKHPGQSSKIRTGALEQPVYESRREPERAMLLTDGINGNPYFDEQEFHFPEPAPEASRP
ncbi:hypothetical protein V8E53_003994 [Lactarius tabidus]